MHVALTNKIAVVFSLCVFSFIIAFPHTWLAGGGIKHVVVMAVMFLTGFLALWLFGSKKMFLGFLAFFSLPIILNSASVFAGWLDFQGVATLMHALRYWSMPIAALLLLFIWANREAERINKDSRCEIF